jgi:hypothetical protein
VFDALHGGSSNHLTRFDCRQHGPEIVPAGFGKRDVPLDRLAIEAFRLRDDPSAFRERFREVSAGKRKQDATGEQWA